MTTVLLVLSIVALWALLVLLILGLLLVLKSLQSVRGWLERIVWGVRAIEKQTQSLGERGEELALALGSTATAARETARAIGSER